MKEKLSVADIADMLLTHRRQSEIASVHPSTLSISRNNPEWPSSQRHMQAVKAELERTLTHSMSSSQYPEHRQWVKATLKYLKTMELFNDHE